MPFTLTCQFCDKLYKSRDTKSKYCSHPCFINAHRNGKKRKCTQCGREFYEHKSNPRIFCSRKCYLTAHQRAVIKRCKYCGSKMKLRPGVIDRYTYCSKECRHKDKRITFHKCIRCGKTIRRKGVDLDRGVVRKHCSEICRRPPKINTCKTCGKKFRKQPSQLGYFCCFACYRRYQGETSIETRVRRALESIGVRHIQEHKAGRYSIDFYIPDQRIALEVDGTYWHRDPTRDARKVAFLQQRGIKVVRISEAELTNTNDRRKLVRQRLGLI